MILRSLLLCRTYATAAKPPRRLGKTIDLDHFLQRSKALSLWRKIVRDCKRIEDQNTRKETLQFAREEFQRNRDVQDISKIRYMIAAGETDWEKMERYINGL